VPVLSRRLDEALSVDSWTSRLSIPSPPPLHRQPEVDRAVRLDVEVLLKRPEARTRQLDAMAASRQSEARQLAGGPAVLAVDVHRRVLRLNAQIDVAARLAPEAPSRCAAPAEEDTLPERLARMRRCSGIMAAVVGS